VPSEKAFNKTGFDADTNSQLQNIGSCCIFHSQSFFLATKLSRFLTLASTRRAASGTQASTSWSWLPEVLVLATRTHPGCSSARLQVRGQELQRFLLGGIWEVYLSDLKLAPVSQGLRDFMARRKRCGQCRQSMTCSISIWWLNGRSQLGFAPSFV